MITVAVDVETSGFKIFWHDVITLGMAVFENDVETPIATFYGSCRPLAPNNWDEGSTKAHGFILSDTVNWQDPRLLCIQALHFLKPFYVPGKYTDFVAHQNHNFDYLHLQSLFVKTELQFSLYKIFNEHHTRSSLLDARAAGYSGNKLDMWGNRLGREFKHHNALDDAIMCGLVDIYLRKERQRNSFNQMQIATELALPNTFELTAEALAPAKRRKKK